MIRYSKQKTKTSCGPVAVLNVLKWAGISATEKDLPKIKQQCHWRPTKKNGYLNSLKKNNGGTTITNIYKYLNEVSNIETGIAMRATVENIDSQLEKGYAVIIQWFYKNGNSHFVFCPKKTSKGNYLLVNATNKTVIRTPKNKLRKMLSVNKTTIFGTYNSVFICVKKKV